jgi:chemotaxis protein MotA
MATTTPAKVKAPKPASSLRPDFSTLAGIAMAMGGVIGGLLLEKGDIGDIAQVTAAFIVLGGTIGAVLVTTPMAVVLRSIRSLRDVFFEHTGAGPEVLAKLIHFSSESRKNGIVSLEQEALSVADPFLRKAMTLVIDGAELSDLRRMMEIDIDVMEQNAEAEAKVWEAAGGYAPTVGIIGAVLGLIQVMKHLEDIRAVGHGIAVAFVATVYGVGTANFIFLPVAAKLRARLRDAVLMKEMVLEGISGIAQGLNPTLIRLKLESYCPPPAAPKKSRKIETPRKPEVAPTSGRSKEAA